MEFAALRLITFITLAGEQKHWERHFCPWMTYEQNDYLFTIGLLHNSTSPHPISTFSLDFFHPALIQLTDHDMHLSHWHYSRRWCWGRGLLPIHSRGKGKCYKQTIRFKVCKGSPKIFPPKPVNSPSLKNILFRFCQRWFPPFQYILLNIKLLSLYFENTSKDGPKKYSFSKSYNMGSSIPA